MDMQGHGYPFYFLGFTFLRIISGGNGKYVSHYSKLPTAPPHTWSSQQDTIQIIRCWIPIKYNSWNMMSMKYNVFLGWNRNIVGAAGNNLNIVYMILENFFQKQKTKG